MADILVTSPFQPFTLPTQFKAVFNGYIYCGTVDAVDPSVSQVQVYLVNESGDKVPVAQPLRTNAGGYLVYNGQPAKFVTDSNHSLLVQDSFHVHVWYEPNMAIADPATVVAIIGKQAIEAIRRSYAESGYTLVPGSFESGGTVTTASQVLMYEAEAGGYSWGGTLPKTVPAGSAPATAGGIGPTQWIDRRNATRSVFPSVAAMTLSGMMPGGSCVTLGYYTPNDGGGCEYRITSGNTGDGYFTHNIGDNTATPIYSDTVNVRWFGAKGNTRRDPAGGDDNLIIVSGDDDTPYLKKAFAFCSRNFGPTLDEKWPDLLQAQTAPTLVFSANSDPLDYVGFQITDTIPVGAKISVDFGDCYIMGNHNDFCFGLKDADPGNSVQGFIFSFRNGLFEGPKCLKLNTRWSPGDINNWGGKLTELDNFSIKSQVAAVIDAQSNTVAFNRCSSIIGLVDVVSDNFTIFQTYFNIKPPFSPTIPEMIKFRGSKMYMRDSLSIPFYNQTDGVERAHIGLYDFVQPGHQVRSFAEFEGCNFGGEAGGYSCVNLKTKFIGVGNATQSGVSFHDCSLNSPTSAPIRIFEVPNRISVSDCRGYGEHGYLVDRSTTFLDAKMAEVMATPQMASLFDFSISGNTFSYNAAAGFYQGVTHPYFRLLFEMLRSVKEASGRRLVVYDDAVDGGQYLAANYVRAGAINEIRIPAQCFKFGNAITSDGKAAFSRLYSFDLTWYTALDISAADPANYSTTRRTYRFNAGYNAPNLKLDPVLVDGPTTGRGAFSSITVVDKVGTAYPANAIPKTIDLSYISIILVLPDAVSLWTNSLFVLRNIDEGRYNLLEC